MSRLRPKQSAQPITKILRVSGFELRMICSPDIIMKQTTKTTMAPTTGAGMIDNTALSLGEKPSRTTGGDPDPLAGRPGRAAQGYVARRGIRGHAAEQAGYRHSDPVGHQAVADALG